MRRTAKVTPRPADPLEHVDTRVAKNEQAVGIGKDDKRDDRGRESHERAEAHGHVPANTPRGVDTEGGGQPRAGEGPACQSPVTPG